MAYDVNSFVKLGDLKTLTQRTKAEIQAVENVAADAIKYVSVSGNTVSFWKDADHTGTADFTVDFPKELFLDAARTAFIANFAFNPTTYPGATNPSLEGKPVLVLAVRGTTDVESGTASDTVNYSFLNMEDLVDVYTIKSGDSAKVLSIANNEIEVHISAAANNAIEVKADGLHVDISGKADKVSNATAGHVATLDASGNIADSGVSIATSAQVTEMLNEVYGTPAGSGE